MKGEYVLSNLLYKTYLCLIMNKLNKKTVYSIILIILLALIVSLILLYTSRKNENVIATYSINQAGQIRNESEISEETFDEYGNLTHYKYKMNLEDGSTVEKIYDIKYTFDSNNRITKVAYDNNYIEVSYNSDNKISKLINQIDYDDYKNKTEYNFTYDNTATKVASKKYNIYNNDNANNLGENYITYENYTITETTINNEKYIKCISINEDLSTEEEYLYKIRDKAINYTNVFSLLNIAFDGYFSYDNDILHNNFNINIPIFHEGKFIYLKGNRNSYFNNNCYCDNYDRILKSEFIINNRKFYNEMYCMYKNVNDKVYYRYSISASKDANRTVFNFINEKLYLNNNDIVYKIETLENKNLTEEEYQKELNKFEKYFEKNKKDDTIYYNE